MLKIKVSVEQRGGVECICGKSWDDIEFQNLLYKRRNYLDLNLSITVVKNDSEIATCTQV